MELTGLIIAGVAAVAAIFAAIFAGVQASNAKQDRVGAETARDEARGLAEKANAAFERQAVAQERLIELREAELTVHEIRFDIAHLGNTSYAIQCADLPALQVTVGPAPGQRNFIQSAEAGPRDLGKGDIIRFIVSARNSAGVPRIRVEWTDPETGAPGASEADVV